MDCSHSPAHDDRRAHYRFRVERRGKLAQAGSAKYLPIRTRDLSLGGCLAEVEGDRAFSPGDEVEVVIAPREGAGVLRAANVLRGRVVRVKLTGDERREIAFRYTA